MTWAVLVVVGLLVLTNLANHRWLPAAYPLTCPVVAVVLLGVARLAGLSWTELGLGRGSVLRGLVWAGCGAAVVAVGYAVAWWLPLGRDAVTGPKPTTGQALRAALVEVPLATVLLEEVAFRSVLLGLLLVDHSSAAAVAGSSALFGLWHVAPALATGDGVRRPRLLDRPGGHVVWVAATVLFTAAAGVLFCVVRLVSGSVFAAMGLHWATNGLGWLFRLAPSRTPAGVGDRRRPH